MTLPLVVLAFFAVIAGGLNIPIWDATKHLEHWLYPVIEFDEAHPSVATGTKVGLAVIATLGAVTGLVLAVLVYLKRRFDVADKIEQPLFAKGWYYDSSIAAFMGGPGRKAFDAVAWFDKTVVDGAVNGVATVVREGSARGRLIQTGYVRSYALGLALGAVVIAAIILSKAVL